ncbi:MAG: hypothetical protein GY852_09700, partial [bacterium]|nr:hypothetical protein [bacterium]
WQCKEDETYIPPSLPEVWEIGHTQSVHKQGELRKSLGLADAPPSVVVTPGAMEGFQKMLKETEIIKSAPYMFKEEEE